MARINGRAPNHSVVNNRPYVTEWHLSFFGRDDAHAEKTVQELAAILTAAGYLDVHCQLVDPHDGHIVSEFLVKEGDGEDEESPPETV